MKDYTRDDNVLYSIPQSFADKELPKCPFCYTDSPHWLVREEWKFLTTLYYFKCEKCGSILVADKDDVDGMPFTTSTYAGKRKTAHDKELRTIYVKVEKIDLSHKTQQNMILAGEEVTVEDIRYLAKNHHLHGAD